MKRVLSGIVVGVLFLSVDSGVVFANINIKPEKSTGDTYRVSMKAGESRDFPFLLFNVEDKTSVGLVYPSDQLTATGGGPSYTKPGEKPYINGLWSSGGEEKITLEPREIQRITYKVTVPEGTIPGQYVLLAVARESNITDVSIPSDPASQGVSITGPADLEIGKQIIIDIQPEKAIHELSIEGFKFDYRSSGAPSASVSLKNTGTILQKPEIRVLIKNVDGTLYPIAISKNNLSFYQGTSQSFPVPFVSVLPAGKYIAEIEVLYGSKEDPKVAKMLSPATFTVTKEDVSTALNALDTSKIDISGVVDKTGIPYSWVWVVTSSLLTVILLLIFQLKRKKPKKYKESDETPRT